MLIPVQCHACGVRFEVEDRHAGKMGTCPDPKCRRKFLVPALSQPPSARRKVFWAWLNCGVLMAVFLLVGEMIFYRTGSPPQQTQGSAPIPLEQLQLVTDKPHPASPEKFEKDVVPFLKTYCFDCHANGAEEGGLALDAFTKPETFEEHRKTAELVYKMISAGVMPPEDGQQPESQARKQAADWIDARLNYVDCGLPHDPGRVTIRRLNRAEYNNTIRDLVGIDFEPAADFPSDEVGNGFDNIGDVLSLPPLLLEKYLEAAETIARKAIVADPERFGTQRVAGKDLERTGSAGGVNEGGFVTMASSGSVIANIKIPRKSEYLVRVEAMADQAGPDPARMELCLDGKKIKVFDIKGRRKADTYETKLSLDKGQHKIEAAFINDYYKPDAKDRRERDRNLYVREVEVVPTNTSLEQLPESHRRIIFLAPDERQSPKQAVEKILEQFIGQAFRRPATEEDIEKFTNLALFAISEGETLERGIQVAVTAVLVSPHFLFRVEDHAQEAKAGAIQPVTGYELASRLSYFLWSSMPDEELFELAAEGTLHQPQVLKAQVRRMLKDPKSAALVDNFASQWLNLRNLEEISPDPKLFPDFDDRLRRDMRTETEKFFEAVLREDRSVMDFLDADFTFLNKRLAKHYGISGVKGDEFRKVSLKGQPRAGVLTQASILSLTSNPTRTSPVKRGKWIMENFLNESPPPPPPDVPELEETAKESPEMTLREQLALHSESPGCASCHVLMDPLGLGFENFDAIGQWRERDGKSPVDASGELPGGQKFEGPLELIQLLKQREEDFRRCLAEKMLTYALGRGLEYYDRCAVDEIAQNMQQDDNRFSRMVLEVIKSKPFLYRRGEETSRPE